MKFLPSLEMAIGSKARAETANGTRYRAAKMMCLSMDAVCWLAGRKSRRGLRCHELQHKARAAAVEIGAGEFAAEVAREAARESEAKPDAGGGVRSVLGR